MELPRVTWEALRSWCELRDVVLDPWESLALVDLGNIRADVLAEDQPQTGSP